VHVVKIGNVAGDGDRVANVAQLPASSSRSESRPSITVSPFASRQRANAFPNPRDPPVTIAT